MNVNISKIEFDLLLQADFAWRRVEGCGGRGGGTGDPLP